MRSLAAALVLVGACSSFEHGANDVEQTAAPAAIQRFKLSPPLVEAVSDSTTTARFVARDEHATAFFTDDGFALALGKNGRTFGLHWTLPGARAVTPHGIDEQRTRVNDFRGARSRWKTSLATYRRVGWQQVFPGIDLTAQPQRGSIEYSFAVAPGADPSAIRLHHDGADQVRISDDGTALELHTDLGTIREDGLHCWQDLPTGRTGVACRFAELQQANGGWEYTFAVDRWDPVFPLTIDPVISWASYLGGGDTAYPYTRPARIALDGSGDLYIVGTTNSPDFPGVGGGFDATFNGGDADVFVTKVAGNGTGMQWATYLGGSRDDYPYGVDVDAGGNVFVAGGTDSSNFPTVGGFDSTANGADAFVAKISADGATLVWSSYLGGSASDSGQGVAVDGSGNVLVTGYTTSTDFPTPGGFDTTDNAGDAFVTKIAADGSSVLWSSYLGGTGDDSGRAIEVDAAGDVYVAGSAGSSDFPTTNGFDIKGGAYKAFATKISSAGSLLWSSKLGGSGYDFAFALAVDSNRDVYIGGDTRSPDFPVTGFDTTYNGGWAGDDGFVAKIDKTGTSVLWSTYLGGSSDDEVVALGVDSTGSVIVTGATTSTDFPTATPFQAAYADYIDDFVAKISPTGANLVWSSYLGGTSYERSGSCVVAPDGSTYVIGSTQSTDFVTTGGFQTARRGSEDGFITKVTSSGTIAWSSYLGAGGGEDEATGVAVSSSGQVYVAGWTAASSFPAAGGFDTTFNGDATDAIVAKLDASGTPIWTTFLGGSNVDKALAIAVDASGNALVTGSTSSPDFPLIGAFDSSASGGEAFAVKIAAAGTSIVWSSYLGGAAADVGTGITVDASNNVYVTGQTSSIDFPSTNGLDTTLGGTQDAFVTKLASTGTLAWSTYLGGSGDDRANAIAVDASGAAYAVGDTTSLDFPAAGGVATALAGGHDAFITKLTTNGGPAFSSYLGGAADDGASGVAVDATGSAYIIGTTSSADFPAVGGFDTSLGGSSDAFVTKLDASGSSIAWSSFLGGSTSIDHGAAISLDSSGNVHATGWLTGGDFPLVHAFDTFAGGVDAWVAKLASNGSGISWSSYVGGSSDEHGNGIAVDASGATYVVGFTRSTYGFTLLSAFDNTLGGTQDAFVVRIAAEQATGTACTSNLQCASGFCADGYCCDRACNGGCERCNTAGSEGTCVEDASRCTGPCGACVSGQCLPDNSKCTGNCDKCVGSGSYFNCYPDSSLCSGNCASCWGQDTSYNCHASEGACPGACSQCMGSGTAFSCEYLTSECRAAAGPCDVAENCTGATIDCPPDVVAMNGTACRAAVNDCDVAETCNGISVTCPVDAHQPDATPCDDGNDCTANDRCSGGTCQSTTPALQINPSPVVFPATEVGTSATPIQVSIQNNDDDGGSLTITSISAPSAFPLVSSPAPVTVAGGANTALIVGFSPTSSKLYNDVLTVSTSNPACPTFTAVLLGNTTHPSFVVMPSSHDFGTVDTGGPYPAQQFTITNQGTADFVVESMDLAPATDFVLDAPALPATIAAGASLSFTVTARPTTTGGIASTLTIRTDIPSSATAAVMLSAFAQCRGCPVEPAMPDGGCCDTRSGSSSSVLLALAVLAWMLRRRAS